MLLPNPRWLDAGDNAWQLTAATLVALQSMPGLVVFYGGIVKKKWAINSAFMAIYAFAVVLVVWVLWAYNMAFGPELFPFVGTPGPALSVLAETARARIPAAAASMPAMGVPMATLVYFQFGFAAISVIILAGALVGRMRLAAWVVFVPLWLTFSYTIGAFSLWGGGWLARLGVADFAGGYVVHLAAATSGFVAAWMVGPRLRADRESVAPNNLLVALAGAGILWVGWNGFNGGAPFFANADAAAAVLNTNLAAATAVLVWTMLDAFSFGRPSVLGAINGMIVGLVAITPAAGYVDGYGALLIGIVTALISWLSVHKLGSTGLFRRVDDALGVTHTHGVAAIVGGLLTGVLADPAMLEYIGTGKDLLGARVTGLLYGNPYQLLLQVYGALFIIALNAAATCIILKLVSLFVPLRMDECTLRIGDDAAHGEEAYAIFADHAFADGPSNRR